MQAMHYIQMKQCERVATASNIDILNIVCFFVSFPLPSALRDTNTLIRVSVFPFLIDEAPSTLTVGIVSSALLRQTLFIGPNACWVMRAGSLSLLSVCARHILPSRTSDSTVIDVCGFTAEVLRPHANGIVTQVTCVLPMSDILSGSDPDS
jgi:hypothetical protein